MHKILGNKSYCIKLTSSRPGRVPYQGVQSYHHQFESREPFEGTFTLVAIHSGWGMEPLMSIKVFKLSWTIHPLSAPLTSIFVMRLATSRNTDCKISYLFTVSSTLFFNYI